MNMLALLLRRGDAAGVGHIRAGMLADGKADSEESAHVGDRLQGGGPMSEQAPSSQVRSKPGPQLNPAAMPVADAARMLSRAGGQRVTEAMLAADIDAGAPTNPDGTINLVHYAAWLVKEMAERGGGRGD
jgi:hypothetical protein